MYWVIGLPALLVGFALGWWGHTRWVSNLPCPGESNHLGRTSTTNVATDSIAPTRRACVNTIDWSHGPAVAHC